MFSSYLLAPISVGGVGLASDHQSSSYHLLPTAFGWWVQNVSKEVVGMLVGGILKVQGRAWSVMMCLHGEHKYGYATTSPCCTPKKLILLC